MDNRVSQKVVNVAMSIMECKCVDFFFSEFSKENKKVIAFDKYSFSFAINVNVLSEDKSVSIELGSVLASVSEDSKGEIATIKSIHKFKIINFDEVAIKTERGPELPEQVIPPLLGISVSNLRGLFVSKLEGSIYSNALIPLIDANQLMPNRVMPALG